MDDILEYYRIFMNDLGFLLWYCDSEEGQIELVDSCLFTDINKVQQWLLVWDASFDESVKAWYYSLLDFFFNGVIIV